MNRSNIRELFGQKPVRAEVVQPRSYLDTDPSLPLYHFEGVPRGHRLKTVIRSARAYVQCVKALGLSCPAIHQMLQGHAPSPLDPSCEYELVFADRGATAREFR